MRSSWTPRMRPTAAVMLAAALSVVGTGAHAQDYPSQDMRFLCAFPAGSGADVIVRYFAEKMRPLVRRTIIVENKPGAGGNIAAEAMVRSKPDGHTVFIHAGNTVAGNMHLIKRPPFDAAKAIQVAATINKQAFMLAVDARRPWKTVAELTAYLKEKGASATYAVSANSGVVMGAIYNEKAGLQAVQVHYRLAQDALNDMAGGKVDYALQDPVFALSQQREGRMRVLAVASAERLKSNPELPTMTEAGVPMDLVGWFAAMVPSATPKPIVAQLNRWFSEVVATEETQSFLKSYGGDPWISTPEEGQARLLRDIAAWGDYIRIAKLEPQ
jgi:tripartite-type tricarboxylate transporter receptor subunit TctC